MPRSHSILTLPTLLSIALGVAVVGCGEDGSNSARVAAKGRLRSLRGSQQNALFKSIRTQLRTLPEDTQVDLRPPTVVLDGRSSADGQDVEAIVLRRPEAPDQPANLLVTPRGNGRFRSTVRPGDTVKYFVNPDRETRERIREAGDVDIATYESIPLIVAQVLRDDALLFEGGLRVEIRQPFRMEVWRIDDNRMEQIQRRWAAYAKRRDPPLGWHPSPDEAALAQLTERLNEWLRQTGRSAAPDAATPDDEADRTESGAWSRPQLLESLDEVVSNDEKLAPFYSDAELRDGYFRPHEARMIQAATWRRDIARWARGGNPSPMATATALLDWTARNVQLVEADELGPRWPWETLMHGRATAEGRAWLFAGLCWQQNLTPAAVVVPLSGGGVRTLVGVLDGDALRLFDPVLGTPLPGSDPSTVASLTEIQSDDALLRRLDLPDAPYPVTAESAAQATVGVIASPLEMTRRAARLATRLRGDDAVALAVPVDEVAERLEAAEGVETVSLWPWPHETLRRKLSAKPSERRQAVREFLPLAWRPHLWKARLLHFRGLKEDPDAPRDVLAEARNDHRTALLEYMHRSVRPKDSLLRQVTGEKRDIYRDAKTRATLWLATLSFDEGAYRVSNDWLENAALATEVAEPLKPMVVYSRARALEALGETERAADLFDTVEGPQAHGARLRAVRLREAAGADDTAAADAAAL